MSTKRVMTAMLTALMMAGLLLWPEAVKAGVRDSIVYCLTVLTPSLFPFMALTAYAVDSGAGETFGRAFGWVTRHVFRLPEACAAAMVLGFLGGYPAGAKAASLLLEQGKITEKQAGRLTLFCVAPGVAFVVTFLGGSVFGDTRIGWLLFWSVTVSGLLLGLVTGFSTPVPEREPPAESFPPAGALIRSAGDASRSVLLMCACIVLFSGFTGLLRGAGLFQLACRGLTYLKFFTPMEWASLLSFLLEVTGGVGAAAEFRVSPAFFAFGLGFGGLCVHLQVFACFRRFPLSRRKFFLFRFFHGGLAAACCVLFGKVFHTGAETMAAVGSVAGVSGLSAGLAGGLSLLLMCVAFLVIAGRELDVENSGGKGYNEKKGSSAKE